MSSKDIIILKKILNKIHIIESITNGLNLELFLDDEKSKRAVCMTLINIGELVRVYKAASVYLMPKGENFSRKELAKTFGIE